MKCDDQRLIERVKCGDREAQRLLYNIHAGRLLSLSMRYLSRRDIAEDTLHDAFIKILRSIDGFQYRGEGSLKAWMDRVTINTALEWLKKNKRVDFVSLNSESEEHNKENEPSYGDIQRISQERLMQFIKELPDGYRAVFNLFCIEKYSHREIAAELNINEKSSSSQLLRARKLLASRINEYMRSNE
ncbi:MAG: RNA polymerase sigma factor [Rikenellaceae bacterium]